MTQLIINIVLIFLISLFFVYVISKSIESQDSVESIDKEVAGAWESKTSSTSNALIGTCIGASESEPWTVGSYAKIPNTIFVSCASYRDDECKDTVYDLFAKATHPNSVYVGVVQQNKEQKEDCFDRCEECSKRKQSGHIRVTNFSFMEAKGPTFARFHASKLWRGEEFYLQIDSHMKFEQGWDVTLIQQMRATGNPKSVIGGYPPTDEQMKLSRDKGYSETTVSCSNGLDVDGMPNIGSAVVAVKPNHAPIPCMTMAAGLMCFPGTALREVPYDPYLSYSFFGEELLFSIRLWTAGYDLYAIGKPIATHHYTREGKPRYNTDHPESEHCRKLAMRRIKYLLGLIPQQSVHPDYMIGAEQYGIGKVRSLIAYWEKSGFLMHKNGETVKVCEVSL
jgi:hypothetical protein